MTQKEFLEHLKEIAPKLTWQITNDDRLRGRLIGNKWQGLCPIQAVASVENWEVNDYYCYTEIDPSDTAKVIMAADDTYDKDTDPELYQLRQDLLAAVGLHERVS